MSKSYRSVMGPAVAAAMLWLACLGNANAILVRGSIDPIFGTSGTLSGLYWTADISFNVNASCLAAATQDVTCAISGLTATGTVNDGTDGVMSVNYLATPSSPPTQLHLAVDASQQVIGIGSTPIGFGTVTFPALNETANLWVQLFLPVFNTDGAIVTASQGDLIATLCQPLTQPDRFYSTSYSECTVGGTCTPSTDPTTGTTSVRANAVITQVPEPGSLALMLAAVLAALPLLRRHESRRRC